MSEPPPKSQPILRRKSVRVLLAGLFFVILLLLIAPTIVARTPLCNILVNRLLAKKEMHGSIGAVALGWVSPLSARDIAVARNDGRLSIHVGRIDLPRSLWQTWRSLPEMGTSVIRAPAIDLHINSLPPHLPPVDAVASKEDKDLAITATTVIEDGSLRLYADDADAPLLAIDHVDLTAAIRSTPEGRCLEVEPVQLLDNQELTVELFDQGLQLVAPLLANTTDVRGRASLRIDRCRVPVDRADQDEGRTSAEVQGEFQVHQMTASLKDTTILAAAVKIARSFDLDLPHSLQLVDNTTVRFHLQESRVFHEGLAFLVPELSRELVWRTRGSVGLDESLDLEVAISLPSRPLSERPLLAVLASRPIRFRVGGTVDNPELRPEGDWLRGFGLNVLERLRQRRRN